MYLLEQAIAAPDYTTNTFSMQTHRIILSDAGYPYQSPTVKFTTPCFHPNVDSHGNICLDILKEKWSALYEVDFADCEPTLLWIVCQVRTILLSIQSLLGEQETIWNTPNLRYWNLFSSQERNMLILILKLMLITRWTQQWQSSEHSCCRVVGKQGVFKTKRTT